MDTKEGERVVVAKPVASRPNCSAYKSFSELLSGAINDSSPIESSRTTVSVIRPKTVRLKPAMNHPPAGFLSSQGDIFGAALSDSSDKSPKPDSKQSLIYRPIAKLVSKTTVSLLANIKGNCSTSQQQPRQLIEANLQNLNIENVRTNKSTNVHQSIAPRAETNLTSEPCRIVKQNSEEDLNSLASATNGDRPSYDGYNWRKYGQKQVKGSEYPRSYYKCTYPNCPVKKKVERSFDGQIAEIVYKGEHNHSKTQPPKHNSEGTQGSGLVPDIWSNNHNERNEVQNDTLYVHSAFHVKASQPNVSALFGATNAGGGSKENSCGLSAECEEGRKGFEAQEEEPRSKRRKNENQSNEASISEEGLVEPRVMVQSSTDSVVLGDGFRWRKYGQKVVKGSPYARSYYRCTNINCNVRKHVERAIDDPRSFVTTYEGKHNHEMPLKNSASVAYDKDSQVSLSKNKP
ncbi:PREDICTED: WRKY transcription factor 44 isoform X1 [Lupinus angustifolius]|uniref:WRKY transcription factor 44 isoform X1 n=1 Tax=Lupinus angustifolius TaxID=3871 RepID=UPI00092E9970|nr:PREDICTED: WRKY transcription factor 44 isoform X1 [Lupinus angustifolius]XP_019444362.1 PREDICTED: WRKY transcription factor 44 isoform X1 [Lupinus angustifolius]XP_019444363.1 PREDICTED: WRKY transcription factor 44 isoform X1 [Lupinus angustifolius]XP_019444364.1 PREDICTED: WRKY transcription factor 44 isoform X1 [Lupinus angustifolius]XP_019444365.1 PREDICTED: WRKY transcription factor 44 isoform X1 [Lupinus angustifolius]XP_019444366.1 PREDICTED: WRKY transcription factor 44 isoform X1